MLKKNHKIIISAFAVAITVFLVGTFAPALLPNTPAAKADAARQAVAAQAAAAEAVAYGAQRVVFRYIDQETDIICYYVISDRSNVTGGIDCIPIPDLGYKGRNFVLNY